MVRIKEYSPSFDEERFAAHEKFFVEDVRRWVGSSFGVALPAERTPCAAYRPAPSSHSRWGFGIGSLRIGLLLSPGGGYRPRSVMPSPLPRAYLTAGTREPFFLVNATRWADALRAAGAAVMMTERVGERWRLVLAGRVPADGGLGLQTLTKEATPHPCPLIGRPPKTEGNCAHAWLCGVGPMGLAWRLRATGVSRSWRRSGAAPDGGGAT